MRTYPYADRDLLAEREKYSYSRCADDDFLEAWRSARQFAVERIVSGASAQLKRPVVPAVDGVALVDLLRANPADGIEDGEHAYQRIEALVHKFEVFRRLFSHYDADRRRHRLALPAAVDEYLLFGESLATIAERKGPLQALSTLLKLVDRLCSQAAASFTSGEAARLARLVDRERWLVERLPC
jgi:hypothetical protein